MRQLPVSHQSAQAFYDELCQAQAEALKNRSMSAADIIHRIEYVYDIKQEIACELIRLEKKLCRMRDDWSAEQVNSSKATY